LHLKFSKKQQQQPTNIEISNNRDEKKIEKDHHLKKEKRAERNYHYPIQQKNHYYYDYDLSILS